jgi:hypothetical protein
VVSGSRCCHVYNRSHYLRPGWFLVPEPGLYGARPVEVDDLEAGTGSGQPGSA